MTHFDAPALAGLRILIPRAPGRGTGLARLVEAAGGTAVVAPLISREAIDEAGRTALDDAVAQLAAGTFAWVAVTSVNAVDELAASAHRVGAEHCEAGPGERTFSALGRLAAAARWAVVGPATARALAVHGIVADLTATQNSATGMLAVWPDAADTVDTADDPQPSLSASTSPSTSTSLPAGTPETASAQAPDTPAPPRVLLPLGDLARPTLERGLTTLGYTPVRVTAYRTVSHPAPPEVVARWQGGGFDAVVLTSGSVAREAAAQLGTRPDVLAVAIGEPTRDAAFAVGQPVAAVARTATDDALFAALVSAVGAATAHRAAGALPGAPGAPGDPAAPASPADLLAPGANPAIIEEGATPSPRRPGVPHIPEES